ncbi:hypothetical protein SAMN02910456_00373 [Ruminococcaceae bacterium YRB3002]|nr:hypothetical protein SAMN02910456_00373 [Ruminococcaceae bacterium YRB3002]
MKRLTNVAYTVLLCILIASIGTVVYADNESLDIEACEVCGEISPQIYTGSSIEPSLTIFDGSYVLEEGKDYWVDYENNVDVGQATITISGEGNYSGTRSIPFDIVSRQFDDDILISSAGPFNYTGSRIIYEAIVYDQLNEHHLVWGIDYDVSYENNIEVGTATLTIIGKGNYFGRKTTTFEIVPDTSGLTVSDIGRQIYTGSVICPALTVRYNGTQLTLGTDYTVSYSNNVDVGIATVTVTCKGDYSGTITKTFTITAKSISSAMITSIASQPYTGSPITPVITVKDGSKSLTNDTDYTLAYSNNVNVGTATVTIIGKGNYKGTKTATFIIVANTKLTISPISDQTYTGSAIMPEVTVTSGSKILSKDTDYTVAYSNNVAAGTATVIVTGNGSYSGTATASFFIMAKSVSGVTLSQIYSWTYTGSVIEPIMSVKDGDITLRSGYDYEMSYSNNLNVGTATMTVIGIGNYAGTKTFNYEILPKSLTSVTIYSIADQNYTACAPAKLYL